jgi:hypothetical protein
MYTIRCPSCRRPLNLPEQADVGTAQCPLCGTPFDVSSPEPERSAVPVVPVVPHHSGVTAQPQTFHPPRPDEPDEDYPGGPLTPPDRAAMESAALWLRAAAYLGVTRTLLCGCGPVLVGVQLTPLKDLPWVIGCLAYLAACVVVLRGAEELKRPSSRAWAVTGCSLAALATLGEVLLLGLVVALGLEGPFQHAGVIVLKVALVLIQGAYMLVFLGPVSRGSRPWPGRRFGRAFRAGGSEWAPLGGSLRQAEERGTARGRLSVRGPFQEWALLERRKQSPPPRESSLRR